MTDTHYQRLGVGRSAAAEEIRAAYLRQARENHPDKLATADPAALRRREQAMVAINAAWFVLRDPDRRRLYDLDLDGSGAGRRSQYSERPGPGADPVDPGSEPSEFDLWPGPMPPEYGGHGSPVTSIARLYTLVMVAIVILMVVAFVYAVIRSGSVGIQ